MNIAKYLIIASCIIAPQFLLAAESVDLRETELQKIQFDTITKMAFDHSGKYVTSRILPDGSTMFNMNGRLRSVTVARLGENGKIDTYCTPNENDAKNWMVDRSASVPARVVLPALQMRNS